MCVYVHIYTQYVSYTLSLFCNELLSVADNRALTFWGTNNFPELVDLKVIDGKFCDMKTK